MENLLKEKFEGIIENCFPVGGMPSVGWHQIGDEAQQEFIDAMQSAYDLAKSEEAEKVRLLNENIQSMQQTNAAMAKRLFKVENYIYNRTELKGKEILSILNPTKQ